MSTHLQSFYFNIDDTLALKMRMRDAMRFRYKVVAVGVGEHGHQRIKASGKGLGSVAFNWNPGQQAQLVQIGRHNYYVTYEGKDHANAT